VLKRALYPQKPPPEPFFLRVPPHLLNGCLYGSEQKKKKVKKPLNKVFLSLYKESK